MDGCMGRRTEERWRDGSLREGGGRMMDGFVDGQWLWRRLEEPRAPQIISRPGADSTLW